MKNGAPVVRGPFRASWEAQYCSMGYAPFSMS